MFDWLWLPGPDLIVGGRRGRRVLRTGEPGTATIVGIGLARFGSEDDTEHDYSYALDVRPDAGGEPFRCGVRQKLSPRRAEACVGAVVPVRIRGRKVVIDWERFVDGGLGDVYVHGWRMVDPPAPGVTDPSRKGERKRIAAGRAAVATVLGVEEMTAFGLSMENIRVEVELRYADDGATERRRLERLLPPAYARQLVREGAVLPCCGVDKNGRRVTIDWEAFANAAAPGPPASTPA